MRDGSAVGDHDLGGLDDGGRRAKSIRLFTTTLTIFVTWGIHPQA
jgi:hypothetical protein